MRKINPFVLLCCCLFFAFPQLKAQQTREKSIYFPVDGHTLTPSHQTELAQYVQSLEEFTRLEIVGHTDSTASSHYNDRLSQKRARAVEKYCQQQGIPNEKITVSWKGELQPASTPNDLPTNRRVTLTAYLAPYSNQPALADPMPSPAYPGLDWLYDRLASEWQEFWVDPTKTERFETKGGMRFTIPNSALPTSNPSQVKIIIKEYLTLGDMLANRITTTSNDQLIGTAGSFQIYAIQGPDTLNLKLQIPITVEIPTDSVIQGMQAFDGRFNSRGHLNWNTTQGSRVWGGQRPLLPGARRIPKPIIPTLTFWNRLLWKKDRELKFCLGLDKRAQLPPNAQNLLKEMRENNQRKFEKEDLVSLKTEQLMENAQKSGDFTDVDGKYLIYTMTIERFGYINCDRFINEVRPLFSLEVGKIQTEEDYMLIFPTLQSVMPVYDNGQTRFFPNVPDGLPVKLICFKMEKGKIYYGEKQFTLDINSPIAEVKLEETPLGKLSEALAAKQF